MVFDAPAPFNAGELYLFEEFSVYKFKGLRVIIDQAHDAFPVAQELPNTPGVKAGGIEFFGVDLCKIAGESERPVKILWRGLARVPDALQVFEVAFSGHKLREKEKLFSRTGRDDPHRKNT